METPWVHTAVSFLIGKAVICITAILCAYLLFSLGAAICLIIGIILGKFVTDDVAALLFSVFAFLASAFMVVLGFCIAQYSFFAEKSTQIVCAELSNLMPNKLPQVIAGVSTIVLGMLLMRHVPALYGFLRRDAKQPKQQPPKNIAPMGYFTIDKWTAWEQYDKILADHEVRAFRAYLMNYHDAKFYDKWTPMIQVLAAVLVLLGMGAIAFGFFFSELNKYMIYISTFAIPSGIFSAFISNAPSFIYTAWAKRCQNHIEAGSRWLQLHRNANVRRLQLRQMGKDPLEKDEVAGWCDGLAAQYYEASKITVPSETTYKMFDDYNIVKETMDKRRRFRQVFMNDTENSDEARNRNGRVQGRPPIH